MTLYEFEKELEALADAYERGDFTFEEYKIAIAEIEDAYRRENTRPQYVGY